jgi:ATP-binding cassette, subfamily B, bacterial MsbA
VLEDGRITAIGPHDELLNTSPTYRRLYQLQFMEPSENGIHAERELGQLEPETPQLELLLEPAIPFEDEE